MNLDPKQYHPNGQLRHLLSIEGLHKQTLIHILDKAEQYFEPVLDNLYSQKIVANVFFEPSTRTRSTFDIAAQKLNAKVLNLSISHSSTSKGETLLDTIQNLIAMQCSLIVLRHSASGASHFISEFCPPHVSIINAGDGCHAHPTQALLDMYTIRKHLGPHFQNLRVAIVGDVLHSRVARSQIHALHLLNVGEIRLIGPKTLLPEKPESLGVTVFHDLKTGLRDVGVVMMLRLQSERMQSGRLPGGDAYYQTFGLTEKTLHYAKPDAIIIHPGPINRGVEIQSEIADNPRAVILDQVTNGIAIRMSVMSMLFEGQTIE